MQTFDLCLLWLALYLKVITVVPLALNMLLDGEQKACTSNVLDCNSNTRMRVLCVSRNIYNNTLSSESILVYCVVLLSCHSCTGVLLARRVFS